MGGMAVGAWAMARALRSRWPARPLRIYAGCEIGIAALGALLAPGFEALAALDAPAHAVSPALALLAQLGGTALLCGPPAMAMGATLPALAAVARAERLSLARLYGLNIAGAAAGVLLATFALLPALGVSGTIAVTTALNLAAAVLAFGLAGRARPGEVEETLAAAVPALRPAAARTVAFCTGFSCFLLEVSWFRSLRAAYQSTTDSFALMLVSVLLPLGAGAWIARRLPARRGAGAWALATAGSLALGMTPLVERLDALSPLSGGYAWVSLARLGLALLVLGVPMLPLGVVLPWLLDRAGPAEAGRLYAVNTLGAVLGSLSAAWFWLPAAGSTATAWVAGALLLLCALLLGGPRARALVLAGGAACAALAVLAASGVGRLRVQGAHLTGAYRVLASAEGPDATVSVVEHAGGSRELVIDGFQTSGEAAGGHYMAWMGRLPILAHPAPHRALVIGFGTGQTANAVRREGAWRIDIAEISSAVLELAPFFASNEGVLGDARVRALRMDGRAWLRRTGEVYDVITLEPMPPHFAGMNALYSREFYELCAGRLGPGGIVAQWLPLHLVAPHDAASIVRTFLSVLPGAALWIDPRDRTGVLLGRREAGAPSWPGLGRGAPGRDLSPAQVVSAVALSGAALAAFAHNGEIITDDNQLLAYRAGPRLWRYGGHARLQEANLEVLRSVAAAR
jgi:spermidine synthase